MLVYIRRCEWDRIMHTVTKDDIAPHLRQRLEVGGCLGVTCVSVCLRE